MPRLVFIDDDETELQSFRDIVGGSYDCITVHWPRESTKLFTAPAPSIFVSDLYLPARTGDRTPTTEEREDAARAAKRVADRFDKLFEDQSRNDKARLKDSMEAIGCAYAMLGKQWRALGQSPDHGI